MRKLLLTLCSVAVLALGAGCSRGKPSPEFDQASRAFNSLYAQKLDDAFLDPTIPELITQLEHVPGKSSDAKAAGELLQRLKDGKARMEQVEKDRAAASRAALQPAPSTGFSNTPSTQTAPAAKETPDAGQAGQPTAGMSLAEFDQRFSDCFEPGGPISVSGQGMRDTYKLKGGEACKDEHPGFDQLIVVSDGKALLGIFPKSAVFNVPADGGQNP